MPFFKKKAGFATKYIGDGGCNMKIEIGYGEEKKNVELPDKQVISIVRPNDVVQEASGRAAVLMALANPVGTPRLRDLAEPGEKIVIVTSDITRPMPSYEVLPLIVDELSEAGVTVDDITIVLARGDHRAHTEEEKRMLIGSTLYGQVNCVESDPQDCVNMGTTKLGTPVDISRVVAEADLRICIGNIDFHYFAGYSGGSKAIMPGTSTLEAIEMNYSRMNDPDAHIGQLYGNPIRGDIDDAARFCKIDFILNVVLDEKKKIVYAVAGDYLKAHRKGCEFLDKMYKVEIPERADIVIASANGAPKDINLYQTEKVLENAKYAVKDGGTVILVGACNEGMGNKVFEQWMNEAESPQSLVDRIGREFKLGGHKAAAMATVMVNRKVNVSLVSEMDADAVSKMFMTPFNNVQDAVDAAIAKHGNEATIIVMPFGGATLPIE